MSQTPTQRGLQSIVEVMHVLAENPAITDTLWIPGRAGITAFENLWQAFRDLGGDEETIAREFPQHV